MPTPPQEDNALSYYNKLPKDVQEAMFAQETANAIQEIAEREGVFPQVSLLAEITGDVMLGILPIIQFRQAIQEKLPVGEEKARRIAQTIRDKVFAGIADSLRKVHNLQ